ncbi:hypothetical protein QQP08_005704 [Theobroma cacao]|nr:hypothetical protein QQP08_005704 [Theobroma cacao]
MNASCMIPQFKVIDLGGGQSIFGRIGERLEFSDPEHLFHCQWLSLSFGLFLVRLWIPSSTMLGNGMYPRLPFLLKVCVSGGCTITYIKNYSSRRFGNSCLFLYTTPIISALAFPCSPLKKILWRNHESLNCF